MGLRDLDAATIADVTPHHPQPVGAEEDEENALDALRPAAEERGNARKRMRQAVAVFLINSGERPSPSQDCTVLHKLEGSPASVSDLARRLSRSALDELCRCLPAGPYCVSSAHEQNFSLRIVDVQPEALATAASKARAAIYARHKVGKGGRGLKANKGLVGGPLWGFMLSLIKLYAEMHGDERTTATIESRKTNCYAFVSAAYYYATGKELGQEKKFKKAVRAWKRRKYISLAELLAAGLRRGSAPDSLKTLV